MSSKGDSFVPVETVFKNMAHLEQYVERIVCCSSKYCNITSISYAPMNLIGKYSIYPSYGDYPETYMLKSYGKWWRESEGHQQNYRPQDTDPLGVEDYIILSFEKPVVPRDIYIYETFNPGAVTRIWGRYSENFNWRVLWEDFPQIYPSEPRLFHPTIKKVNLLVNQLRLEFNLSELRYYTAIDAVLLGGYYPVAQLQQVLLKEEYNKWLDGDKKVVVDNTKSDDDPSGSNGDNNESDLFAKLPHEIIVQIFQYLDLQSLSCCAQVNKMWYSATLDPILYHNLSLKRYWPKVTEKTFNYFIDRCKVLKKIDLSWCGCNTKEFSDQVQLFLSNYTKHLTHISLTHCYFVINDNIMKEIGNCHELVDLRLTNLLHPNGNFQCLSQLRKLVSLDLSSTTITEGELINILKANSNLKHLIIDYCNHLNSLDRIAEVVAEYNKKLTVWRSWYTKVLTPIGVNHLSNCINLKELDLGWCVSTDIPGECLEKIASNCKQLQRLILSGWRAINNNNILPIILSCKNLSQLDLLGIKSITNEVCETALNCLPKLRLLDISFCPSISLHSVDLWLRDFPDVTIQCSPSYEN